MLLLRIDSCSLSYLAIAPLGARSLFAARRNQILGAAAAVFAEKGFHRATTKDIAVRDFFVAMFHRRVEHLERAQEILRAILPEVLVNAELREHYYRQFVLRVAGLLERYVRTRIELGWEDLPELLAIIIFDGLRAEGGK